MKIHFILIWTIFFSFSLIGQINTQVSTGVTKSSYYTGFNLNSGTKPTWKNQDFLNKVRSLNTEILRYPGGTISQY